MDQDLKLLKQKVSAFFID